MKVDGRAVAQGQSQFEQAPSSDGLAKKPKSLRQSSGRKPGGQAGHPGSTLKRVADPDVIVQHPLPEHCDGCGARLGTQAAATVEVRRQVFDLLKPVLQVTEHRGLELLCSVVNTIAACFRPMSKRRCNTAG